MGCCGVTYEDDIEKDISDYLKTLNISDELKITLLKEVKEDLKKKSLTDNNFDPSRYVNVEKTVNYYKNFINMRLKDNEHPNAKIEKEIKIENNINENKFEVNINKEQVIKNKNEEIKFNSNDINNSINTGIKEYKDDKNESQKEKKIQENKDNKVNNEIKEEPKENKKVVKEEPKEIKEDLKENKNEVKEEIKEVNREENQETKVNEEIKEDKKEEEEINWKEMLKDDNNFSQKVPFDFKSIFYKLQKASLTPQKLNPYYTLSSIFDFTKFFNEISSALSMGFSDITDKCGKMRQKFAAYPDATDIQNLLQTEINLNIHKLNGENNKKLGHGKDGYKDYVSACRTFLRLLWFLEYLIDVFENVVKDDGSGPIKTILSNSYDKVLAPHHTFLVRSAVGIALKFSSAGNVAKNVDIIFGIKEYNDEAKKIIRETIDLMKIIWKGGNDFYEKYELLDLE